MCICVHKLNVSPDLSFPGHLLNKYEENILDRLFHLPISMQITTAREGTEVIHESVSSKPVTRVCGRAALVLCQVDTYKLLVVWFMSVQP